MVKKVLQQGHSDFDARSVLPVREHDKMARTPLVAFFNIPSLPNVGHHTQDLEREQVQDCQTNMVFSIGRVFTIWARAAVEGSTQCLTWYGHKVFGSSPLDFSS
jgi:hypothetical protein